MKIPFDPVILSESRSRLLHLFRPNIMLKPLLFATFAVALAAPPVTAAARDELLRVAPPDAALIVVVQNAREHVRNVNESPFGVWFPTTSIGKQFSDSAGLKLARATVDKILKELGTDTQTLLDDVFGDAIAFAYSPSSPGRTDDERAVILIRPRKREVLQQIVDRLNDVQMKSGEVKSIAKREHGGVEYFERKKGEGSSEFYCFRGEVFAFSTSEADVKAVIDRDKAALPVGEKEPELVGRMRALGIAESLGVILVNPRALDAEVKAKVASAKPEMKRFLEKFAQIWAGLDSAAIYLTLDKSVEVGVSLRFQPEKLPPDARKFLASLRDASTAEALIPKDALFGFAAHGRASEFIELINALAPIEADKTGVKEWLEQKLGPIVDGPDNLKLVLDSLGPNWAAWAEPPVGDSPVPVLVAAIEISGEGESRAKAEESLVQALDAGFLLAQLAYNNSHRHPDQLTLKKERDPKSGAVIKSLVNEKVFPPGFRPSFAIQKGYLVLATSPDTIKRFEPPAPGAPRKKDITTLAKLNGVQTRTYLKTHGAKLAKFLADVGVGDEKKLREHIDTLESVLELIDSAEVIARPGEKTLQLAVRINTARPLKK
jgi:hypothetical protein